MKISALGLVTSILFASAALTACGQSPQSSRVMDDSVQLDIANAEEEETERAKEALFSVEDLLMQYKSVHSYGVGLCRSKWASHFLGLPVTEELEFEQIGVSISFSDEAEMADFARASIIFGGKIPTISGDVQVCADLSDESQPEPVVNSSNQ